MQRRWSFALLMLAGCRDRAPESIDAGTATTDPGEVADVATRPMRVDGHPDASLPLDAACEGMRLALVGAVLDPHCAVPDYDWLGLVEMPGLKQEAHMEGSRVVFALANRGSKTIDVPLRLDDRHPERAFSAVAETDGGIFALAPPTFDYVRSDAGVHVHSARIRLPPGGAASVTMTIELVVGERIDRRDATAPKRVESPLMLHIGQLVCPFDTGDPAALLR